MMRWSSALLLILLWVALAILVALLSRIFLLAGLAALLILLWTMLRLLRVTLARSVVAHLDFSSSTKCRVESTCALSCDHSVPVTVARPSR